MSKSKGVLREKVEKILVGVFNDGFHTCCDNGEGKSMSPEEALEAIISAVREVVPEKVKEVYVNLERADNPSYIEGEERNSCRDAMLKQLEGE